MIISSDLLELRHNYCMPGLPKYIIFIDLKGAFSRWNESGHESKTLIKLGGGRAVERARLTRLLFV